MKNEGAKDQSEARREFLKTAGKLAVYTTPTMMLLMKPSTNAIAKSPGCNNGVGNSDDCLPPGLEKNGKGSFLDNDNGIGSPGNPQNQGGPQ